MDNIVSFYGSHDSSATFVDKEGSLRVLEYERLANIRYAAFNKLAESNDQVGTDDVTRDKFISHITGYEKIVYLSDNEYVKDSTITSNQIVSKKVIDRKMKINFLAEIDDSLNWNFFSLKENSEIKVGENMVVKFEGKNLSNKPITATADFIAFPEKILPYIIN